MQIECPHCQCNDVQVTDYREFFGVKYPVFTCNFCLQTFQISNFQEEDVAVSYYVMLCPKCSSDDVIVTHTARPVRYHRCRNCRNTFKSVEKMQKTM